MLNPGTPMLQCENRGQRTRAPKQLDESGNNECIHFYLGSPTHDPALINRDTAVILSNREEEEPY
jgi:hypothetical protein